MFWYCTFFRRTPEEYVALPASTRIVLRAFLDLWCSRQEG